MVQWLGLGASTAGGTGSILGRGTKIPQAMWHGQKKKKGGWKLSVDGQGWLINGFMCVDQS